LFFCCAFPVFLFFFWFSFSPFFLFSPRGIKQNVSFFFVRCFSCIDYNTRKGEADDGVMGRLNATPLKTYILCIRYVLIYVCVSFSIQYIVIYLCTYISLVFMFIPQTQQKIPR
jgi:hypothetical protein